MTEMMLSVLFAVMAVGAVLCLWRLFTLRSQGTPVIIRRLPASGVHGWRHGLLRYRGTMVCYYRVRSLLPSPNLVLSRGELHIHSHREVTPGEAIFMDESMSILELEHAGQRYELAVDKRGEMALRAWVESAPTQERQSISPTLVRRYFHAQ